MAITFDGQNDRITTSSQGLTVPSNVAGTFQAGGLAIGAGSTIIATNNSGFTGLGTANPQANLHISNTSGLYPIGIKVDPTSTAPSRRAAIELGFNWNVGQDSSGNGTRDFYIYDAASGTLRFNIDTSGNIKLPTAGTKILNSSNNPILQQTGSVLQVIWKDLGSGSFSATSTSATHRATGFTNSITPNASTSKILHIVTIGCQFVCDGQIVIARGGTVVSPSLMDSYRDGITASYTVDMPAYTFTWLDSPATTSACNYELYCRSTGCSGTMFVGSSGDFNSSWTLMEVAA